MNKRNILKSLALGAIVLLGTSCTKELEEQQLAFPLHEGEVALQCLPANMAIQHVKSRATDTKTGEEQQINNIHVFVFTAEGNYLKADDNDAFQGYRYVEGGRTMVLQSDMFANQTEAENATVVIVANVPRNTFGDVTATGAPSQITDLSSFESFVYNLPTFTATLPEDGLPMYGQKTGVNLSTGATEKIIQLQLKSMMARIDLDFTMNPYQSSDDRRNPALRFNEVRIGNFPTGGTIKPQLDTKDITDNISLQEETTVQVDGFSDRTLREGEPQELTLYMFEHARAAKELSEITLEDGSKPFPNNSYPEGITPSEEQRYKNYLANDEAAYIELEGIYTNHNDYKYAVTYRIYPGANATDDFTIKANRQYKHNITVKGITVNNMGTEALLDTRVDIDSEDNPYFIEMLREREHDAHFCVTPMDVYIYRGGTVEVEILNADKTPWIRMEPLGHAAEEAGDGKRDYFTVNLLEELSKNTSYTVTSTNDNETHEERIYFYIDENTPTKEQAANHEEVPEREATIQITYTEDGGTQRTHTRTIPIRQAGMLPVQFSSSPNYWFYIEYYEEYLEHYDGKDLFTHTYNGLEWGLEGVITELGGNNYAEYLPYGWRNTMTMMQAFRSQTNEGKTKPEITLNDKPRSAAEYCYNKNKRNAEGEVETCHWYLPSIREIENAMDKYYGTFDVFQDNWYWSSNPGPGEENRGNNLTWENITSVGESTEYARATKSQLKANGTSFTHATSEANKPYAKDPSNPTGWDTWYNPKEWQDINHGNLSDPPYIFDVPNNEDLPEGIGGFARRNKVFRIRAAYIYDTPNRAPSINNTTYYY